MASRKHIEGAKISPSARFCTQFVVPNHASSPHVRSSLFADDDEGQFRVHVQAIDSSGHGNHLPLITPPTQMPVSIRMPGADGLCIWLLKSYVFPVLLWLDPLIITRMVMRVFSFRHAAGAERLVLTHH